MDTPFDRNGVIRHRIFGFMPPPALRVAVNRLLEEKPDDPTSVVVDKRR